MTTPTPTPPGLAAVLADDRLLDRLSGRAPLVDSPEPIVAVLQSWTAAVDGEPDFDIAAVLAAVAVRIAAADAYSHDGPDAELPVPTTLRPRRRRSPWLIAIASGSAAGLVVLGGVQDARPGDALWSVAEVIDQARANSLAAKEEVSTYAEQVDDLLDANQLGAAAAKLELAKLSLQKVRPEDGRFDLQVTLDHLSDKAADKVVPPNATPAPTAPGVSDESDGGGDPESADSDGNESDSNESDGSGSDSSGSDSSGSDSNGSDSNGSNGNESNGDGSGGSTGTDAESGDTEADGSEGTSDVGGAPEAAPGDGLTPGAVDEVVGSEAFGPVARRALPDVVEADPPVVVAPDDPALNLGSDPSPPDDLLPPGPADPVDPQLTRDDDPPLAGDGPASGDGAPVTPASDGTAGGSAGTESDAGPAAKAIGAEPAGSDSAPPVDAATTDSAPTDSASGSPAPSAAETGEPAPSAAETGEPAPSVAESGESAPGESGPVDPGPTAPGPGNPAQEDDATTAPDPAGPVAPTDPAPSADEPSDAGTADVGTDPVPTDPANVAATDPAQRPGGQWVGYAEVTASVKPRA